MVSFSLSFSWRRSACALLACLSAASGGALRASLAAPLEGAYPSCSEIKLSADWRADTIGQGCFGQRVGGEPAYTVYQGIPAPGWPAYDHSYAMHMSLPANDTIVQAAWCSELDGNCWLVASKEGPCEELNVIVVSSSGQALLHSSYLPASFCKRENAQDRFRLDPQQLPQIGIEMEGSKYYYRLLSQEARVRFMPAAGRPGLNEHSVRELQVLERPLNYTHNIYKRHRSSPVYRRSLAAPDTDASNSSSGVVYGKEQLRKEYREGVEEGRQEGLYVLGGAASLLLCFLANTFYRLGYGGRSGTCGLTACYYAGEKHRLGGYRLGRGCPQLCCRWLCCQCGLTDIAEEEEEHTDIKKENCWCIDCSYLPRHFYLTYDPVLDKVLQAEKSELELVVAHPYKSAVRLASSWDREDEKQEVEVTPPLPAGRNGARQLSVREVSPSPAAAASSVEPSQESLRRSSQSSSWLCCVCSFSRLPFRNSNTKDASPKAFSTRV